MTSSNPQTSATSKSKSSISVVFGLSAFLSFCVCMLFFDLFSNSNWAQVLRPKWTSLYHARKKQSGAAIAVTGSTEDALWMDTCSTKKFLKRRFWLLLVWMLTPFYPSFDMPSNTSPSLCSSPSPSSYPSNYKYTGQPPLAYPPINGSNPDTDPEFLFPTIPRNQRSLRLKKTTATYGCMWCLLTFSPVVAIYLLIVETRNIIRIRQAYLGTQSTITDRTLRCRASPKI